MTTSFKIIKQNKKIFHLIFVIPILFFTTSSLHNNLSAKNKNTSAVTQSINLKTAIKFALKNNPDIQNTNLAIVKFQQEQKSFQTNYYPQIEILSFLAPIYSVKGEGNNIQKDYSKWGGLIHNELSIIQPIYTFGALSSGTKAMEAALLLERSKKNEKVNDILFQVKKAYYETLLVKRLDDLSLDVEEKLTEVLVKAKELYNKEDSNIKEYELIQLELFEVEFLKLKAELDMNKKLASKKLIFLCGLNPHSKINLQDKSFPRGTIKLASLKEFLQLSLKKQPVYKQVAAGLKALRYKKEAKEALLYPTIFIAGKVSHSYTPMREQNDSPYIHNRTNYTEGGVALGAKWKLDFFKKKADVKKTDIELKQLRNKSRKAQRGIPLLIEKAYLEVGVAEKQLKLSATALRKSSTWVASVQSDFDMGEAGAKDLLEGFGAYLQAKQKLIRAKFKYQISLATLVKEVGSKALIPQ